MKKGGGVCTYIRNEMQDDQKLCEFNASSIDIESL